MRKRPALAAVPLPAGAGRYAARICRRPATAVDAYLRFDQRYYLPDDILAKVDRMSMAHSIEVRPPFLDHRIVEFAASLPDRLKVRGRAQKIVLRELMKRQAAACHAAAQEGGLRFSGARLAARPPAQPAAGHALVSGGDNGLFRRDALESCVRRHLDRRANLGYHLWGLMLLFLWMKRWRIQTTQASEQTGRRSASIATST